MYQLKPVGTNPKIKYLGVLLDETLSMKDHIKAKCQVAAYNIKRISMIRKFIDMDCAKMLASSLVLTHLDYSNSALAGLPRSSLKMLQKIQNWAAKVVLGLHHLDSSISALKSLHWLPIKERIDYKVLCHVFKALNNMAPALSGLFHRRIYPRGTRASSSCVNELEVPRTQRSTFAARAISVYGPRLWNDLPPELRTLDDFKTFKSHLKTFFFRKAFN
jgi:hypothetical protein